MISNVNSINKKVVFLFGAGAVLDWGAPMTICDGNELTFIKEHDSDLIKNRVCCLTHLMTSTGFYTKDGQRVSKKIFDLLTNSATDRSVNFETIIDFVEEVFNYYASKNNKSIVSKNIFSFIDLPSLITDLFYFEIKNQNADSYSLHVPKFEYSTINNISNKIPPEQKYCELLIKDLIGGIIGHVSKYSYHTKGHNVIYNQTNNLINEAFVKWCSQFIQNGFNLRMYTLNYDRIFKILLQEKDINVFEGFDIESSTIDYSSYLLPNINKIVSDFRCNSFYNLHGSASWYFDEYNSNDLPGYQYYLTAGPELNNPTSVLEIEKNKLILLSNIITGYKKVLKTAISPFRQMLSAFDRDCIEADQLFIIGYSYGDEHINDIIRNARKFNSKVVITVVGPSFSEEKFMFDFLLHWGSLRGGVYKKHGEFEIISEDYKVRIIKKTFLKFLKEV